MRRVSMFLTLGFAFVLGLAACNSVQHKKKPRKVASLETEEAFTKRFDEAFAETFAQSAQNSGLISKISAADPNSNALSQMILDNGIKDALSVEFELADDYNKVSDETYADCLKGRKKDPEFECDNIMDTDVYKRSMAVWMYSDYARSQAKKAYQRLLDLGRDSDESELITKVSLQVGDDASRVSAFARTFKANFKKGVTDNVERGFAYVTDKDGRTEYRRGAMNTLDYAALAELANVMNEVNEQKGISDRVDVNLESLYRINRESYKEEAKSGDAKPEELEAFMDVIKGLAPTRKRREIAAVGWHDVWGKTFQRGEFALTYDDGPHKTRTTSLLNYLGSNSVERSLGYKPHATFFVQAQSAQWGSNAHNVSKLKNLGYGVASHSYSHEDFSYFVRGGKINWNSRNKKGSRISLDQQLVQAKSIIENVYGTRVNYFRLPYASGRNTRALQEQISANNLVHVFWNVNADDWRWKSVARSTLTRNYIREIEKAGRGVILLHDIHENTVGPLTQALIGHFAANKNRIKIVPLEEGVQETFVNISANGKLPSRVSRITSAGDTLSRQNTNTSVNETKFPHVRKINASKLNVRTGPSSSYPVCGYYLAGDQIEVLGQNAWFVLNMKSAPARSLQGSASHRCGANGYIHNGANYSTKMN